MTVATATVSTALLVAAVAAAGQAKSAPLAWTCLSAAVWAIWLVSKGWGAMHVWDKVHLLWGVGSIMALYNYVEGTASAGKPFQDWGDVYYFCGSDYYYCRCDFTWNAEGWAKAFILWSFVVTASLGLQKLVIHSGLHGLLPGEEIVTKESLVSFCWRLIPYWLNSWEQQWGAECSSVMFELPHFALELLVVLPCVQILSSRLKILLMPAGRGLVPPFYQTPPEEAANMAPVIMTGLWEERKSDQTFQGRLRANFRVLTLIVGVSALAAFNALFVPLYLERVIHTHPRSIALLEVAHADGWLTASNVLTSGDNSTMPALSLAVESYVTRGCGDQHKLAGNLFKHAQEISRMQSPHYQELTMCVEAALTIMRLSCEQYFTLISVFAAYLFYRQRPSPFARRIIWLNHRVSNIFKKAILYSFPAICWLYGAGIIFSSFASLVFWGQPVARLWESLKTRFTTVVPVGMQEATEAQIEQMNGNCAVCWSSMNLNGRNNSALLSNSPGASPASSPGAVPHSPQAFFTPRQMQEEEQQGLIMQQQEEEAGQGLAVQPQGFMEVPFNIHATQGVDPVASAEATEDEEALERDACKALPCGHAFHDSCIAKWLAQCHAQSRQPTCPMCNLVIKLEVSYQIDLVLPWPWARAQRPQARRRSQQAPQHQLPLPHHNDAAAADISTDHQSPPCHQSAECSDFSHAESSGRHNADHIFSSSSGSQHAQRADPRWHGHSVQTASSAWQQSTLAGNLQQQPSALVHDYYFPAQSSLSPQLAQERLAASGQTPASLQLPSRRSLSRGFAAVMADFPPLASQPATQHQFSSRSPAASISRSQDHAQTSPMSSQIPQGQAWAGPGHQGHVQASPAPQGHARPSPTSSKQSAQEKVAHAHRAAHNGSYQPQEPSFSQHLPMVQESAAGIDTNDQATVAQATASDIDITQQATDAELQQQQPAVARRRNRLRGLWSPAATVRRMVGNTRRNRAESLARASSSNASRVSARTDLADASAMPSPK